MALDGTKHEQALSYMVPNMEVLLDELLVTNVKNAKQEANGQRVLYEVLDQVRNGRKSMNSLFYSKHLGGKSAIMLHNDDSLLQAKSSQIAHQWSKIERRTISQTTSSTLKIDAPVIFSWTQESVGIKDSSSSAGIIAAENCEASSSDQTTNNKLFKIVSTRLNTIASEKAERSRPLQKNMNGGVEEDDTPSKRLAWANPNFRVDPLQSFVAKALPKQPKKELLDKKKKASKRKGLFGFWNNQKKKDKEKTEKSKESEVRKEAIPKKYESKLAADLSAKDDNLAHHRKADRSRTVQESRRPAVEFDLDEEDEGNQDEEEEVLQDEAEAEDEYGDFEQASESINQALILETPKQTQSADPVVQPVPSLLGESNHSPLSMDSFVPLQPKRKD